MNGEGIRWAKSPSAITSYVGGQKMHDSVSRADSWFGTKMFKCTEHDRQTKSTEFDWIFANWWICMRERTYYHARESIVRCQTRFVFFIDFSNGHDYVRRRRRIRHRLYKTSSFRKSIHRMQIKLCRGRPYIVERRKAQSTHIIMPFWPVNVYASFVVGEREMSSRLWSQISIGLLNGFVFTQ